MIPGSGFAPTDVTINSEVSASGDAHVEQQVGTQFNDSVLHNVSIYTTQADDPPERQQVVAKANLDGGNPRRAEEILAGLIDNGHATVERCYLYVLSILSARSFTEITADLTEAVRRTMATARSLPRDEWTDAIEVVDKLLRYVNTAFGDGAAAPELAAASDAFGALESTRQVEIDQHMDLILSGAVQERLSGLRKYQVAIERMKGRAGRAWKFFEADPRQPMLWHPPRLRPTAKDSRDAILGSLATLMASVFVIAGGNPVFGILGLGLFVAGCVVAVRCTVIEQTHARHKEVVWANFQLPHWWVEAPFDRLVDQRFRTMIPQQWDYTARYRAYLKRRLAEQYGGAAQPAEVKWLIDWHTLRAGGPFVYQPPEPPGAMRTTGLKVAAIVVWSLGVLVSLGTGQFMALLLAAGGWWGVRGLGRILCVSRVQTMVDREAEALMAEEWQAYQRWSEALADRPSDAEVARWFALDKAYLVDEALRRANLRERDLVTHVVLTERVPFARKSRVTNGPPRYEAYLVYVFLLTQYGMRSTRTHLKFMTGEVHNEQRQMFSYDAVASASVTEKGVRAFRPDGSPWTDTRGTRVFQLTLLNGTCIAEVKESIRGPGDNQAASGDEFTDAAYARTSGFDSALRILEAVATEGRDWIARDRERRQRWARNWCTESRSGKAVELDRPTEAAPVSDVTED